MLAMTTSARSAVRLFTAHPRLGSDSGVRIAPQSSGPGFHIRAVHSPEPDDVVVEEPAARVYLAPEPVAHLQDKVLDARRDDRGRVEFVVRAA